MRGLGQGGLSAKQWLHFHIRGVSPHASEHPPDLGNLLSAGITACLQPDAYLSPRQVACQLQRGLPRIVSRFF